MNSNKPLLIIAGATATGKSALAVKLAKKLDTDIISCDSAQVYKYMDIGTAKPSLDERCGVPHHLIDYVYPDEEYSAVRYKEDCENVINNLSKQNKIPLLCGGTGMYFNAVLYEMNFGNSYKSETIRKLLEDIYAEKGADYLYGILKGIDPVTAEKLHQNDKKRVIRAIEIFKVSGKKKSELAEDYKSRKRYGYFFAVLNTDRETLYGRINDRVDLMLKNGLVDEVRRLKQMGYENCTSVQAIGYKEIFDFINGKCTLEQAAEDIKRFTRNYAKRQLTWYKGINDAVWYDISQGADIIIEDIIKRYNRV